MSQPSDRLAGDAPAASARPRDTGLSLAALVLAAVLPLLVFSLGVTYLFEQRERRQKEGEIIALSRAVSAAVTTELESASSVAEVLAASPSLDGDDLGAFHDAAKRVLLTHPGLNAIFVTDTATNTHLAHTTLPRQVSSPGGAAARTEVPLVASTGRTTIFGVVPRGPIIAQPLIPIRAPALRPGRPTERVVSVILLPQALGAVFSGSGIPSHWTGTIVDAAGRIAARNRAAEQFVGQSVTASLAEKLQSNAAGGFIAVNEEGQEVFTAFARTGDTGWSTVIGVPLSEVAAPARRAVVLIMSIGAAALALGAGFAVALGRRIRRAHRAEQAFLRDLERSVAERAEQRALAEQIRRTQRMEAFGQMTGGIAHDFNNILGAIVGNLDLLDSTIGPRPEARELINRAIDAAERGAALTQRLLAFARKQMLQPRATDVNRLVTGMHEQLQHTLGVNIGIDIALQPELWQCRIDPGQLENAILNLAINARDAMPEGGRLSIRTGHVVLERSVAPDGEDIAPGDYVTVAVADSGTGMSAEEASRAFEPFFTTKGVGQGTGLGLSMVYGFARQSGGTARLASTPAGGTTVTLFLPRNEIGPPDNAIDPPAAQPATGAGAGAGILVVEDTELLRDFAVAALARSGYRPVPVGDGPAALAELDRGQDFALLLSDIVLPGGMTGFDIARVVARRRPGMPILFMSGFTDQSVVPPDLAARGIKLLRKPFRAAQLAAAVAEALGQTAPG